METSSAFPLAAASQACMEAFHHLLTSLSAPNESSKGNLQLHVVNNQRARFKIWATNLGALQSGRASLDFRLMETSLTQATILKFLNGLKVTLSKSTEIVRGLRAPIEQIIPDNSDQGFNCSGDSSGSENDSSDDENNTKTELGHNTAEIDHVISSLMRVSFRIKGPGSRTTQLNQKAMAHEELINVDGPAAEDIFLIYSDYDRQYVEEFFRQLRRVNAEMELHLFDGDTESTGPSEEKQQELTNDLVERWAKSITSRRRILAYWRRHARKLAKEEPSTAHTVVPTTAAEAVFPLRPAQSLMQSYAKQSTLQSTLSGTEAKRNVQEVNDIDTVSTVSYSSTTLDESSSTGLPAPPSITPGQTKIVCPCCHIMCPVREVKGRRWREHIQRDLQPYLCTYPKCPEATAMYISRASWLDHESNAHRRAWRCFEHKNLFKSREALTAHLEKSHPSLGMAQIQAMSGFDNASTTKDTRKVCPFCFSRGPFKKSLAGHMALHMERLASFAAPRDIRADVDTSSGEKNSRAAQGDRSSISLGSEQPFSGAAQGDRSLTSLGSEHPLSGILWIRDSKSFTEAEPVTTHYDPTRSYSLITHSVVEKLRLSKTRYPLGMEMTVITPSGRVVALEEFVSIELEARWLSDCDLGTCHISAVPDHVLGTFDAEFLAGKKIIAKLQGKGYVARETSVSVRMIAGLETLNADSRGAQTNKKRNQTFFDWLEEEEKAPETHVEEECYSGSCTTIDKITGVPKLDVPYRAEAACSRCT
nr:ankyrin repeat protein [Colletotrichum truncatum]KAF6801459.1 ankyrin repeat protein [Colletotrichum truncatum]